MTSYSLVHNLLDIDNLCSLPLYITTVDVCIYCLGISDTVSHFQRLKVNWTTSWKAVSLRWGPLLSFFFYDRWSRDAIMSQFKAFHWTFWYKAQRDVCTSEEGHQCMEKTSGYECKLQRKATSSAFMNVNLEGLHELQTGYTPHKEGKVWLSQKTSISS